MTLALVPLAETHTVTSAPALLIILVVLALLVIGVVAVVRFLGRRARRALDERGSVASEPVHQQPQPDSGVLRGQPTGPGQRRQPVQGRPEQLGEQPGSTPSPASPRRVSSSAAKPSLSGAGISSSTKARPPSSADIAS